MIYALSQFPDVCSWVPAPFCSRYPLVRFVECSVQAPCEPLVRGGCRLQYTLDAVLQWIVVQVHGFVGDGDVKATGYCFRGWVSGIGRGGYWGVGFQRGVACSAGHG